MGEKNNGLLTHLLRDVSRSFYLTLRVLPAAVRPQIGVAYLLARATDTIADTDIVPVDERLGALEALRDRCLGVRQEEVDFRALAGRQRSTAEQVLLKRVEEAIAALQKFTLDDQKDVHDVLRVITSGQALDLQRFAGASQRNVLALQTEADLDDYTYRVAGCVGEFWTKICRRQLFPTATVDEAKLLADGVRFGKGLQLVNILRDLPRDLRQGRCYLPSETLVTVGLTPSDLLLANQFERLRPLYAQWLEKATEYLAAGWQYTLALPAGQVRVRLACAWPILIGQKTLERLQTGNPLDASMRIKVPRSEVRQLLVRSVLLYPFSSRWKRLGYKEV